MQLVGSSHTTPTEIILKASWWDWASVILTSTNTIVYICYYSFPKKFIQLLFKYTTILLCSLSPVAKNNLEANRAVGMVPLHDKVGWLFLCPSGFQARGICSFLPQQPQLAEMTAPRSQKAPIKLPELNKLTAAYGRKMLNNHTWATATSRDWEKTGSCMQGLLPLGAGFDPAQQESRRCPTSLSSGKRPCHYCQFGDWGTSFRQPVSVRLIIRAMPHSKWGEEEGFKRSFQSENSEVPD